MNIYAYSCASLYAIKGILQLALTVSLNKLAEIVRSTINPEFFLLQGDFIISDELGTTSNLAGCVYFPKTDVII